MDAETIRDYFDPSSLHLNDADGDTPCGHAAELGHGASIRCGATARFVVHFHLESEWMTECIRLYGCREHAIPLWESLWMRTPTAC